jgi:hypothetical protein
VDDDDELTALTAPFLASDLAQEVQNIYFERTGVGTGAGPATQAVFETFRDLLSDPDEGPVIFLALASVQLRRGAVLAPLRDAALALIESGDANRAWRQSDSFVNQQRKSALRVLAERLEHAPPEAG